MNHAKAVRHEVALIIDLLVLGITMIPSTDSNYQERVIMRSTLTLLEALLRNIDGQINEWPVAYGQE